MLIEGGETAEPTWGRQIEAVATQRDRAAFVALFEHFAPRVKTFVMRSGDERRDGGRNCSANHADRLAES